MPPETVPKPPPFPVFDSGSINAVSPRPPYKDWARRAIVPVLLFAAFVVPPPATHAGPLLGLPSFCLFYRITGWPCPGCGLTRSCVCFAHGRWAESVAFHPLGPPTFLVLALLLLFRLPFFRRFASGESRGAAVCAYVATGLFLVVWAARLAHFLPSPPGL